MQENGDDDGEITVEGGEVFGIERLRRNDFASPQVPSHTMYKFNGFRKLTPLQKCQLLVH